MILWTFSSRNNPEEEGKQKSIELLDILIKSNYLRANSCVIPVPSFSLKWREQFSCEKLFFELINFFFLFTLSFSTSILWLFFFFWRTTNFGICHSFKWHKTKENNKRELKSFLGEDFQHFFFKFLDWRKGIWSFMWLHCKLLLRNFWIVFIQKRSLEK